MIPVQGVYSAPSAACLGEGQRKHLDETSDSDEPQHGKAWRFFIGAPRKILARGPSPGAQRLLRVELIAFPSKWHEEARFMTTTTTTLGTVVGAFENESKAQAAVRDLRSAGFAESDIGIVSPTSSSTTAGRTSDTKAEEGAVAGVATGAALGALWGMGILAGAIPGIGPAIAGGTLGVLLSSAGAGAAVAGVAGALAGMGLSEKDAAYYDSEYGKGRSIVTVRGNRGVEARTILDRNGALRNV